MKFYQKRGFALVVLVLAILGSCVYGISKKPADLPQVSYGNWLRDDADLLTDETEASLTATIGPSSPWRRWTR